MPRPADSSGPAAPAAPPPRSHSLSLLSVLVAGAAVSLGLFFIVRQVQRDHQRSEFVRWAQLSRATLERDLEERLQMLQFMAAFFFASHQVERKEFQQFASEAWPSWEGVRSLEWLPRIRSTQRPAHEAAAQTDGFPGYRVLECDAQGRWQPAAERAEYFPVFYSQPAEAAASRLGRDLASLPSYAKAMQLAVKEDIQVVARLASATIQDKDFAVWRVFQAVVTNGAPHNTEAERRASLAGYLVEALDLRELAEASRAGLAQLQAGVIATQNVALQWWDVSNGKELLYQTGNWPERSTEPGPMHVETYLRVEPQTEPGTAGRRWLLVCRATPAYLASTRPWKSWTVLGAGLLMTVLLAVYLHNVWGRAAKIERIVHERTAELARANQVLQEEIRRREQIEQKFAQERFLMDTLMDTIPDHIYFKDRQSRFLRISKAQAARFKLGDPAQAIGKTDFDFFTGEHAQGAFDDEQEIIRTGQPMIGREEKETWTDGSVSWVSTTKQCLRDAQGAIIGTFGISRDITARKRTQEQLRESQARLQSILDNTSAVIYLKDKDGRFLLINRQFENLFHVTAAQLQGRTDHDVFPKELADAFRANDLKVLQSPTPLQFEEVAPHDEGPHTYVSIKFRLCDAAGVPNAVCGISTDITARKRTEQALAQKSEELLRSNQDLEQFAYVASHDLQEPLRMIASYTQLLGRRYKGKLDQDADEFITYAVNGAERMQTLINDLLAYSRVGTRGKPFAPTDCNEILQRALDNLKVTLEETGVVVHRVPLPKVMGDAVQLTQLFQNLLSNAIKFRGPRPPEIHFAAELRPVPVPVALAGGEAGAPRQAREWVIAVRDNGIGIEREFYDRIFIIFQRLHGRDEYPGTGIGLAVCKKIAERHGGRIWVESAPGQGSTFHFTLPCHEEFSI